MLWLAVWAPRAFFGAVYSSVGVVEGGGGVRRGEPEGRVVREEEGAFLRKTTFRHVHSAGK